MTFKKGKSGNPGGRAKGALNLSTYRNLRGFDENAEKLIAKVIDMALNGDAIAMKLCMERIMPKVYRAPLQLPKELNKENIPAAKAEILNAAFEGKITMEDAERLQNIISDKESIAMIPDITATDPIEASKAYQKIMMGEQL